MESELCPWDDPMILAAAAGKSQELQEELFKQKHADARDIEYQRTPLHWAALGGHDAVVRLLLAHGADVNTVEPNRGRTPLLDAVACRHESVVRQLVGAGADVDIVDMLGDTPLNLAARQRSVSMARLLLEAGANPNEREWRCGQTPLSVASEEGRDDVVDLLLEHGADVGIADDLGVIPLEYALKNGHDGIAQMLAEREAGEGLRDAEQILSAMKKHLGPANPYQDLDPEAALLKASHEGRQDIFKDILEKNAHLDIDARDEEGRTPLSHAAGEGNIRIAAMLLDRGAEVNAVDAMKWTPLMAAAERGLDEMGILLLQRGAHPNSPPDAEPEADVFPPLCLAASAGCAGLVSRLLDAGADPNATDKALDGELTAISRAAEDGHISVVELLLARGVSPNADDRTLLCALRAYDPPEQQEGSDGYRLIRTLVQHGADVFMDIWTDERPLVIAAECGLKDVVELFLQAEFTSAEIRQEHIRNAVCVAAEEGEEEILKMLMVHYVRCDTDTEVESPWEWAKSYEFGQSLELLQPYFGSPSRSIHDSDSA